MDQKKELRLEPVQAVERAFFVLEYISKNGSSTLKELYTAAGIGKASMCRLVHTMELSGYLRHDEATGAYSMTYKPFEIGVTAVRSISYINVIKSMLESLSAELDAIAQFSIEDNNELLCLESFNNSDQSFSIYAAIGQRTPLYATSAGKAILSTLSNDEIREKWDKMNITKLMPNTITDLDDFLKEIQQVRQQSYAVDREENEPGVFCVGSALMNYNRTAIGAISVSTHSLDPETEKRFSETVISYASRISHMLGYINP